MTTMTWAAIMDILVSNVLSNKQAKVLCCAVKLNNKLNLQESLKIVLAFVFEQLSEHLSN